MLIPFNLLNYWGYNQVNIANELGVTPGYPLDIMGVNITTQILYSFNEKIGRAHV